MYHRTSFCVRAYLPELFRQIQVVPVVVEAEAAVAVRIAAVVEEVMAAVVVEDNRGKSNPGFCEIRGCFMGIKKVL